MEDLEHGSENIKSGAPPKRSSKIRDLFTDRVVGIVSGAFIPLVLLFIPLINKYLDNTKEIQTLQIKNNEADIEQTNQRVNILTEVLANSQIQLKTLNDRLAISIFDLKKATENLVECQKGCDTYCLTLAKKK